MFRMEKEMPLKRALRVAVVAAAGVLLAATALAHENNPLRGCWLKIQPQVLPLSKGRMQPRLEYCFKGDGRILGNYTESDGYAGDLEKRWMRIGRSILQIDADRCAFKYVGNDRFLLADCLHEGEWRRGCRNPKFPTTCGR
jgi:hypothetical protein